MMSAKCNSSLSQPVGYESPRTALRASYDVHVACVTAGQLLRKLLAIVDDKRHPAVVSYNESPYGRRRNRAYSLR